MTKYFVQIFIQTYIPCQGKDTHGGLVEPEENTNGGVKKQFVKTRGNWRTHNRTSNWQGMPVMMV